MTQHNQQLLTQDVTETAQVFRDALERLLMADGPEAVGLKTLHDVLLSNSEIDGKSKLPSEQACAKIALLNAAIGWIRADMKNPQGRFVAEHRPIARRPR